MSDNYAYCVVLFGGDEYVPGAIVLAQSIKNSGSVIPKVVLVTDDVTMLDELRLVFDVVRKIDYIEHPTAELRTKKQQARYSSWISKSYTKWQVLDLCEYDKVLLLDADIIVVKNMDEVFDRPTPAACFANAWSDHCKSFYGENLQDGDPIRREDIQRALYGDGFVCIAAVVLVTPNKEDYQQMFTNLFAEKVYGLGQKCMSGHDERLIATTLRDWHHMSPKFQAVMRYPKLTEGMEIFAHHYVGDNPWDMARDEWEDLRDWWIVVDQLVVLYPQLKELFMPVSLSKIDTAIREQQCIQSLRNLYLSVSGKKGTSEHAATLLKFDKFVRHLLLDASTREADKPIIWSTLLEQMKWPIFEGSLRIQKRVFSMPMKINAKLKLTVRGNEQQIVYGKWSCQVTPDNYELINIVGIEFAACILIKVNY